MHSNPSGRAKNGLQFGIRLFSDLGSATYLHRLGVLAEKQGFEFCWCSHDLFKQSAWIVLSAIGSSTSRLKIGPALVNPHSTDPSEIAMMISTLDNLTGGRAVLGIGSGAPGFFKWIGVPTDKIYARTREAILLVRRLLAGEHVEFEGKCYSWMSEAYMRFETRRDLPIYIGGQSERFLRLMGELGDGALPVLFPPEYAGYVVRSIRAGAEHAARDFKEIDIVGCIWLSVHRDGRLAEDQLRGLIAYYGPHLSPSALGSIGLTPRDFEPIEEVWRREGLDEAKKLVSDKMLKLAIAGTPDECISRIESLRREGVTQIGIGGPLGPDAEEAVRLMGRTILPYFKSKG